MDIPDVAGVVVGYRSWLVVEHRDGLVLRSVTYGTRWPARKPMRGHCIHAWFGRYHRMPGSPPATGSQRVPHTAPAVKAQHHCECGVYAVKEREDALRWHGINTPQLPHLVGRVQLWGRLQDHTDGWRAEFAYPLDATVVRCADEFAYAAHEVAAAVAARYGIEVGVGVGL